MAIFSLDRERTAASAVPFARPPPRAISRSAFGGGAPDSRVPRYLEGMATWATVAKLALALPETSEDRSKQGHVFWRVKGKTFAWERPLRRSDLAALGDRAPTGAILAVHVPDFATKDAMVQGRAEIYFTTPHFDGYPIVLVRLAKIAVGELREVLSESWHVRAPASVHAAKQPPSPKRRRPSRVRRSSS